MACYAVIACVIGLAHAALRVLYRFDGEARQRPRSHVPQADARRSPFIDSIPYALALDATLRSYFALLPHCWSKRVFYRFCAAMLVLNCPLSTHISP
eukprot:4081548-Pleurochrysis_carterae.AAC.3